MISDGSSEEGGIRAEASGKCRSLPHGNLGEERRQQREQ